MEAEWAEKSGLGWHGKLPAKETSSCRPYLKGCTKVQFALTAGVGTMRVWFMRKNSTQVVFVYAVFQLDGAILFDDETGVMN